LEAREYPDKGGYGLFALEAVAQDEVLVAWSGPVLTLAEVRALSRAEQGHTMQIDDELYLGPASMVEPADYVNHSCDPNAGIRGQVVLVALRAIAPGEEVCFDYAMADGSPFDEFECGCETAKCRGRVTGNDWQLPELWARYDGYFSAYLQRRIAKMRA
jgi:SET domain-containing protein